MRETDNLGSADFEYSSVFKQIWKGIDMTPLALQGSSRLLEIYNANNTDLATVKANTVLLQL
jgi:hypothetical protein